MNGYRIYAFFLYFKKVNTEFVGLSDTLEGEFFVFLFYNESEIQERKRQNCWKN